MFSPPLLIENIMHTNQKSVKHQKFCINKQVTSQVMAQQDGLYSHLCIIYPYFLRPNIILENGFVDRTLALHKSLANTQTRADELTRLEIPRLTLPAVRTRISKRDYVSLQATCYICVHIKQIYARLLTLVLHTVCNYTCTRRSRSFL